MPSIEVVVERDGTVRTMPTGYPAEQCLQATKFLEVLGDVKSDVPTEELFQQAKTDERLDIGGG
jgi:hypothetical protein